MTETQTRGLKFAYFVLGIAIPILGFSLWLRDKEDGKAHEDEVRDAAMEDSFPASDPPASW